MHLTPALLRQIELYPERKAKILAFVRDDYQPAPEELAGPGLVQKGVNYLRAAARYWRNHGYKLPLELAGDRHQVCKSNRCGKYDAKLDVCQHRRCGCSLAEKTTWSTEACPEEHWLPVFGPAPALADSK